MAAFDALFSLSQTTDPTRNQAIHHFEYGARENIKSIHGFVAFLLWFLQRSPVEAKRWEGNFRDVAYKIEYIIEKYMRDLHQSQSSDNGRMNRLGVRFEDQLKNEMETIGGIVGQVMEERPVVSSSSTSIVVGLDKDLKAIKNLLCGEPINLQVIPIVGMGGIGKTTLATTVYNDTFISNHFDVRVWLTVSQDYRFGKILSGLVDALKLPQELKSGDESQIKTKVFQHLKYRRYLIIMDDVWSREIRDDVMVMFPDDGNGSRIMFTTRQLDVATYPACHYMQCMNDSLSWDLLKLRVFLNGKCPPALEAAGKEIARRCAGLPLALVLVAGLLRAQVEETSLSFWEDIAQTFRPVIDGEVEEILLLSYTYLPHHLRPCFLFIGGLEDSYIKTSRLTKLWVAEGFVKHQSGSAKTLEEKADEEGFVEHQSDSAKTLEEKADEEGFVEHQSDSAKTLEEKADEEGFVEHQSNSAKTLEEKAEEYLEELVKRNLVIVASRKSDGKIKRCNLHDLVRDLCVKKARQEKFLSVLDGCDLPQGLMNERRVIFRCSDTYNLVCPTIHTILCFQTQNFPTWLASLNYYEVLRVLNAIGIDLPELPSQVVNLYHLRYLALKGSFNIPPAIFKLENLQTLIICLASGKLRSIHGEIESYTLPEEIWRMRQLRHLVFDAPYVLPHPPDGLISFPLENLQTLLLVKNLVWDENILKMIPNVKRLGLVYTTDKECGVHRLKDLGQLEKLELIGSSSFSWLGKYDNPIFPTTLRKLSLVGGVFLWKDTGRIIGSLPNLEVLKLLDSACDGDTWETIDGDFPRLEFLLIGRSKIQKWITESSHFPRLKHLVLRSCWNLREIPQEIGDIPTLELIEVDTTCTESLLESARQIKKYQEDYNNDAFQVRVAHELNEELHERPIETAEICGSIFRRILEKTRVTCNRVANLFSNPCRRW